VVDSVPPLPETDRPMGFNARNQARRMETAKTWKRGRVAHQDGDLLTYPGGKNGSGVYQRIISLMPPHEVYIEPFFGGGAIMRLKRPASLNIGIDRDRAAVEKARPPESREKAYAGAQEESENPLCRTIDTPEARWIFNQDDGIEFLRFVATWWHRLFKLNGPVLIYCDPPYMRHTCAGRCRYKYDLADVDHWRLLRALQELNALPDPPMLIISGYDSELYRRELAPRDLPIATSAQKGEWIHTTFQAMTRGGTKATEHLWFNFTPPTVLHDFRYLGGNFRDRERIKRRKTHWVERLRKMPAAERAALVDAINETRIPSHPPKDV
jgi:DNA adenine methylase